MISAVGASYKHADDSFATAITEEKFRKQEVTHDVTLSQFL